MTRPSIVIQQMSARSPCRPEAQSFQILNVPHCFHSLRSQTDSYLYLFVRLDVRLSKLLARGESDCFPMEWLAVIEVEKVWNPSDLAFGGRDLALQAWYWAKVGSRGLVWGFWNLPYSQESEDAITVLEKTWYAD
jgi:hypothetical protein